jgi:hypothetical protein
MFEFAICDLRFAIDASAVQSQIENRKSKISKSKPSRLVPLTASGFLDEPTSQAIKTPLDGRGVFVR